MNWNYFFRSKCRQNCVHNKLHRNDLCMLIYIFKTTISSINANNNGRSKKANHADVAGPEWRQLQFGLPDGLAFSGAQGHLCTAGRLLPTLLVRPSQQVQRGLSIAFWSRIQAAGRGRECLVSLKGWSNIRTSELLAAIFCAKFLAHLMNYVHHNVISSLVSTVR